MIKSAWISLAVSFVVLALKLLAYQQTKSSAVLSDALETVVNVIAAFAALKIIKTVLEPADKEHPYGHGKLEYFSSAFEGGLITFAAIMIAREAYLSWQNQSILTDLNLGTGILVFASVINLVTGLYLKSEGKKYHSLALEASGTHLMSDVWTTGGVIIGLILIQVTGWLWIDPIVAVLVAFVIGFEGFKLLRKSAGGLIDETDQTTLKKMSNLLEKYRSIEMIDIHDMRIMRSGPFHHVDAHVVMPEYMSIKDSHDLIETIEEKVFSEYKIAGEFAFHVDPCLKKYCDQCEIQACPIRQSDFIKRKSIKPYEFSDKK